MRFNWNRLWITSLPLLALLVTGCGGFAASPSISPGMFLLPGLGENTPPELPVTVATAAVNPLQPL